MKRKLFSITVIIGILLSTTAIAGPIDFGDNSKIVAGTEIVVQNLQSVGSLNLGDSYVTKCDGTVTVIGVSDTEVLLVYTADIDGYPSGITFFATKKEFGKMTERYNREKLSASFEKPRAEHFVR